MRRELRLASSTCPALPRGRAKTDPLWPFVSPSRLAASAANGRPLYRDELSASGGHAHWSLVAADACGENVAVGFLQFNDLRIHKAIEHLVLRPIPAQHQVSDCRSFYLLRAISPARCPPGTSIRHRYSIAAKSNRDGCVVGRGDRCFRLTARSRTSPLLALSTSYSSFHALR